MKFSKLENISEVTAGQGAPQGNSNYSNDGLPFIKAGNLKELINTNDEYKTCKLVSKGIAKKYRLKLFPKNSLVFAKSGMSATKGRIYYLRNDAYVVNHLAVIIPNNKFVETKYLKYFFNVFSPSRLIKDESYPSISLFNIKKIEIPLLSLEEQKRIVKILDEADNLRQKRKQAIGLLDEYLKSVFLEMFGDPVRNPKGWNKKEFSKICLRILGGGTPSKSNPDYYNGKIPWVTPKDMKIRFIKDSIDHISEIAVKESSTKLIPKNSVLMVIRSGILKNKLPVAINIIDVTINQDMKGYLIDLNISNPFFVLFFFEIYEKHLLKKVRAVTADNLKFDDIRTIQVITPSLSLQNKFANIVQKTESLKQKMLIQSEEMEKQFQALMQRSFA